MRPERRGVPGHEAQLAEERPGAFARDAAGADELRDLPEDLLELLPRDGNDIHLCPDPNDGGPG
eukprot:7456142-Alexandrium_andersonii.AAC.1